MARKISLEAARAFERGEQFFRSNTEVYEDGGYWLLVLFRNPIARYPVGSHWTGPDSEICTCGHAGMTTNDRLNALSGVTVHGHDDVWLNGWPWANDSEWTSLDPKKRQEPLVGPEKLYREGALDIIENTQRPFKTVRRTRLGEPLLRYTCQTAHGGDVQVFVRPWAAEPAGEIHVPGRPVCTGHRPPATRLGFANWQAFGPAWDKAEELTGPPLYQLAKEAERLVGAK